MTDFQSEDLLILVKTYPNPSKSYRETVCVVAVNKGKELRRLYPIEFRYLDGDKKFEKWQWINAKIRKASDWRPESYNIDNDSIRLEKRMDTKHGWGERLTWIQNHLYKDFKTLDIERSEKKVSIGIIKPIDVVLEISEEKDKEWTKEELTSLRKDGLFDNDSVRTMPLVRKLPYRFRYTFLSGDDPERLRFSITDWECGALYWKCVEKYGENWEKPFRNRFEFKGKDLFFIMGTIHSHPNQWLIIGLVYPPSTYQPYLLNN